MLATCVKFARGVRAFSPFPSSELLACSDQLAFPEDNYQDGKGLVRARKKLVTRGNSYAIIFIGSRTRVLLFLPQRERSNDKKLHDTEPNKNDK